MTSKATTAGSSTPPADLNRRTPPADLNRRSASGTSANPSSSTPLRTAKAKPLGDAWAWSRSKSPGDITAVIAMTLGLAVATEIDPDYEIRIL